MKHFVNYAHRGASGYLPENTLSSFYLGLSQGANGIETDVRMTSDGVLFLFHDDNLERVTNGKGQIEKLTWRELSELFVFNRRVKEAPADKIVKLEDFLRYFHFRDINFAIEIKQGGIESDLMMTLNRYKMQSKTTVTSFNFDWLCDFQKLGVEYKIGYLQESFDDDILKKMRERGFSEACPRANQINSEMIARLKQKGFSVRAWGVSDETLMKQVYFSGANGMTTDYPDLLYNLIATDE